jgi:hypothetical protein
LRLQEALQLIIEWSKQRRAGADMRAFTLDQITHYQQLAHWPGTDSMENSTNASLCAHRDRHTGGPSTPQLPWLPSLSCQGASVVPPSGKVIGAQEMKNMVDASLDGWLTTGRFND